MVVLLVVVLIFAGIGGACMGYPHYNVWQQGKSGEADLRKAEQSRQIRIEEAKANLESQKLNAEAEVARAHGVAEANEIIGDSLEDNDKYLQYLWINGLHDGNTEVIYVATEASLPITEAGRFMRSEPKLTPVPAGD